MASKMQPGITIDSEVWKDFKERYNKNASQKIEELMKRELYPPEVPVTLFSSTGIESFSFQNPNKWNLSFNDSKIQVTNMSYSNVSVDVISETKDIEIE